MGFSLGVFHFENSQIALKSLDTTIVLCYHHVIVKKQSANARGFNMKTNGSGIFNHTNRHIMSRTPWMDREAKKNEARRERVWTKRVLREVTKKGFWE
jgi:hypothetical protein